jgi:hypothetical protein
MADSGLGSRGCFDGKEEGFPERRRRDYRVQ